MFSTAYTPEKHNRIISQILSANILLGELVEVRLKYHLSSLEIGNKGLDRECTVYVDFSSVTEKTTREGLKGLLESAFKQQIGKPWYEFRHATINLDARALKEGLEANLALA